MPVLSISMVNSVDMAKFQSHNVVHEHNLPAELSNTNLNSSQPCVTQY